jgi:DNA polymerase/3'-5' exonuclease PolX|tara:strand:+ start:795 stop:986 length:192 start_codon:yes stop_codon:yes gene_type:complete
MLHDLADDTGDKFKRNAYIRAANSIYELPYKVVNGKKISEGPNKVHGVGKSIAKKIDEYLKKN